MPDRLAADLRRYYGVRLSDVWAGVEDIAEIAAYAAHLPRGSTVGEWYGGWGAITAEEEALRRVEHLLKLQMHQAAGKRSSPPEPKPPAPIREAAERARRKKARLEEVRAATRAGWR